MEPRVVLLALAIQNIMWGLAQPIAGAYADKLGDRKVIAVSIGLYAAGLLLIAHTSDPLDFAVNGGVLIGIAMSGTGIPIMLSVVGRSAPESRGSLSSELPARRGRSARRRWSTGSSSSSTTAAGA